MIAFEAHKSILSVCSAYFDTMFSSSFKEAASQKVELTEIEPEILESLLKFFYTGVISIKTAEEAKQVIESAHLMQVSEVVEFGFEFLARTITTANCLQFYMLAKKYAGSSIKKTSLEDVQNVALNNLEAIKNQTEFLSVNFSLLLEFLAKLSASTSSDLIAETCLKWMEFDPEKRSSCIGKLIRSIDLGQIQSLVSGQWNIELSELRIKTSLKSIETTLGLQNCLASKIY